MTLLERLLRHDAATTRSLLILSTKLTDTEIDRDFDIAHRTLRRTFTHIIANMECWHDLMTARPQRWNPPAAKPSNTLPNLLTRLDLVAVQLLTLGQSIEATHNEDATFIDTLDSPPTQKPLLTALLHLATHGMHHRAQALYMMRKLEIKNLPEGDALSWEKNHLHLKSWPPAQV